MRLPSVVTAKITFFADSGEDRKEMSGFGEVSPKRKKMTMKCLNTRAKLIIQQLYESMFHEPYIFREAVGLYCSGKSIL